MRVAMFSAKDFERPFFDAANTSGHELAYFDAPLDEQTARLAEGFGGACAFANDSLNAAALRTLRDGGVKLIALRCAGFNHVDLAAAEQLGLTVARVPAYSPESVAEHTVALMLALNRKIHRAFARVREGNFALRGLMGFNVHGKTAGIVGTGRIGEALARILSGFNCRLLAFDPTPNPACAALGVEYVELDTLLQQSDIISLNCPLTPKTHHLIDDAAIERMKDGVMLINTSRGAVVDTAALIRGLKSRRIGSLALDVYEEEADLFFKDLSDTVIQDDVFMRLLTFPNVLITAHQAFFTREAVTSIAETTLANIDGFAAGAVPKQNLVTRALLAG